MFSPLDAKPLHKYTRTMLNLADILDDLPSTPPPVIVAEEQRRLPSVVPQEVSLAVMQPQPQQQLAIQHNTPNADADNEEAPSALVPWWEKYEPPRDSEGYITIDARAEWNAGLRPSSVGERFTSNGVEELALRVLVRAVQSSDERLAMQAATTILSYRHGSPGNNKGANINQTQILVKIDV